MKHCLREALKELFSMKTKMQRLNERHGRMDQEQVEFS